MKTLESEFYNKAWQEEREEASLYQRVKDASRWQIFWDQYAPTYQEISKLLIPLNEKLVQSWEEEGLIHGSSRVLDIGCGPGTLTLPLSKRVGEVVALDTSKKMLDLLKEEAMERGLENLKYVQKEWEEIEEVKEYHLVLASNSPAIYNQKTLEKMIQVSRHYCLYMCYVTKVSSPLRSLLWRRIMGEELTGRTFSIIYPFNILYSEGYFPHITYVDQEYTYRLEVQRAWKNYSAYFQIFGKKGEGVERLLEETISSMAHRGLIHETISYRLGVMWWSSQEKRPYLSF